ncbi:hypothetical protein D3C84_1096560 [compost metagenome]
MLIIVLTFEATVSVNEAFNVLSERVRLLFRLLLPLIMDEAKLEISLFVFEFIPVN